MTRPVGGGPKRWAVVILDVMTQPDADAQGLGRASSLFAIFGAASSRRGVSRYG